MNIRDKLNQQQFKIVLSLLRTDMMVRLLGKYVVERTTEDVFNHDELMSTFKNL